MAAKDPRGFEQAHTGASRRHEPSSGQRQGAASQQAPAGLAGHPGRSGTPPQPPRLRCLGPQELLERVREEIGRADRHDTPLCCLLLRLEQFEQLSQRHGPDLAEGALLHAGEALCASLRSFDRVGRPRQEELVIVLPGAAAAQGEAVARRALRRLAAMKIEVQDARQPLCFSIGIAAWQPSWSAERLLGEAHAAAGLPQRCREA